MGRLFNLATEAGGGELPIGEQIRGYLVVISAVVLFCGSIYLLLATNLGAKLGFLVSFAVVSGFLCMLGLIWFTNLTPLNALHGPAPHWNVVEVVDDVGEAKTEAVHDIGEKGAKISEADQGEIKASVDTALTEEGGDFAEFTTSNDYVVTEAEEKGGGTSGFLKLGHKAHYAVMVVQGTKDVEPLPGQAPPPPAADPSKPERFVVLKRDLGSMRQPPLFMSIAFGILFVISLVMLHNTERAEQRRELARKGELEPAPATT